MTPWIVVHPSRQQYTYGVRPPLAIWGQFGNLQISDLECSILLLLYVWYNKILIRRVKRSQPYVCWLTTQAE